MIEMTIAKIAEIVDGELANITPKEAASTYVTGTIEFDSRLLGPGDLFLALSGMYINGHEFATDAITAGAVAILTDWPIKLPSIVVNNSSKLVENTYISTVNKISNFGDSNSIILIALAKLATEVAKRLVTNGLLIFGITGSIGKTSTKDLLTAILNESGQVVSSPNSFNNELGYPWTILRSSLNTKYLILEMSARRPGDILVLTKILIPHVAIVMNINDSHLSKFGSYVVTAKTKVELPKSVSVFGVVVLNEDDLMVSEMAEVTKAKVVRVSRIDKSRIDLWSSQVSLDTLARPAFILFTSRQLINIKLNLHGDHQVTNTLCAAAAALNCKISLNQISTTLCKVQPTSRYRMEVVTCNDGTVVINDAYNANPYSMRSALKTLAWMSRSKRIHNSYRTLSKARRYTWAILGEMTELGANTIIKHDNIGRLVVRLNISRLIVVGAKRPSKAIHYGAIMEGFWGNESIIVNNVDSALELIQAEIQLGDIVLVKASNSIGLNKLGDILIKTRNS